MIALVERFQSELLCAFLGVGGLWLIIWPLSRRLGALPDAPRRAWFLFPLGAALIAAAVVYQRRSTARPGATLAIALGLAALLAALVLIERRRKP